MGADLLFSTNKAEGSDFFLFWILVVILFGVRKMCAILILKNRGIDWSVATECCWRRTDCQSGVAYIGFWYAVALAKLIS